ncbi:unnamed protein product [Amoebophrya sp. A25]|nr:unnamed protein product [Amoebophrya sp. A25]|eukprot:GSA25T00001346001.1
MEADHGFSFLLPGSSSSREDDTPRPRPMEIDAETSPLLDAENSPSPDPSSASSSMTLTGSVGRSVDVDTRPASVVGAVRGIPSSSSSRQLSPPLRARLEGAEKRLRTAEDSVRRAGEQMRVANNELRAAQESLSQELRAEVLGLFFATPDKIVAAEAEMDPSTVSPGVETTFLFAPSQRSRNSKAGEDGNVGNVGAKEDEQNKALNIANNFNVKDELQDDVELPSPSGEPYLVLKSIRLFENSQSQRPQEYLTTLGTGSGAGKPSNMIPVDDDQVSWVSRRSSLAGMSAAGMSAISVSSASGQMTVLPDDLLGYTLTFLQPWADGMFLVSKRFLQVMRDTIPCERITPPVLPCSVHLECDVLKREKLMGRCIYNVSQQLWSLPLNMQRYEWVPGMYCKAREDWQVKNSTPLWKKILKHMKDRENSNRSPDCPHYCEVKQAEVSVVKGYVSDSETRAFVRMAQELGHRLELLPERRRF